MHAGGLPASWLSKKVPLRKVDQLYLGGNRLGEDADGNPMPKEQWCQSEADAGLASGSGWCPQGKPLRNAAAKLSVLDLSDNGFTGEGRTHTYYEHRHTVQRTAAGHPSGGLSTLLLHVVRARGLRA